MRIISRIFSNVFHPLLTPIYGTLLALNFTYLCIFPGRVRVFIIALVTLFTLLIPATIIVGLYLLKVISSPALEKREERPLPYLFTIISYVACVYMLSRMQMPAWVLAFFIGALISLVINSFITLKWKISAHATGIGGLTAAIFFMDGRFGVFPFWIILATILAGGMVGTSRIYLGRHTLGQVIAGYICGALCVYLTMLFI